MTSVSEEPLTLERCVVRNTAARKGRTQAVSPGRTAARHLHYGRIILDAGDAHVSFQTGEHEVGLIGMRGRALVSLGGQSYELGLYDSLYVPRGMAVEVRPGAAGCDLVEMSAAVKGDYPVQLVRFQDVQRDPSLHFTPAPSPAERTINVLLGKNVKAGRLVAGVTFSAQGNWTSWPPHEHGAMLEEAYLFVDMPAPGFGLQMVYTEPRAPELAVVVKQDDIVLIPRGYHPNVAAPGGQINFLWMMAAERELEDRQFGVVNVQPEFANLKSGLDAGRADKPAAAPATVAEALHQSWSEVPVEKLDDGIERQMIVGQKLMVCRLRFPPHVVTADHSHPHEQITLVEKGRVRFTFGNGERVAKAGDILAFPGGFWHGAKILDEEAVLIDIFTPVREDFLPDAGKR
jgi:5-deoxy-glucuronate isomerase